MEVCGGHWVQGWVRVCEGPGWKCVKGWVKVCEGLGGSV